MGQSPTGVGSDGETKNGVFGGWSLKVVLAGIIFPSLNFMRLLILKSAWFSWVLIHLVPQCTGQLCRQCCVSPPLGCLFVGCQKGLLAVAVWGQGKALWESASGPGVACCA